MTPHYPKGALFALRYFFEWGGGCLWAGDDAARQAFDVGPLDLVDPCPLPLSAGALAECVRLADWHDTALNWDYPPDPGPWRQAECDRFNGAADALLATIRRELGPTFVVDDDRVRCAEDPELDVYLADPAGFTSCPLPRPRRRVRVGGVPAIELER